MAFDSVRNSCKALRTAATGTNDNLLFYCVFLRFSAMFCENPQFSVNTCASQELCFLGSGTSAKTQRNCAFEFNFSPYFLSKKIPQSKQVAHMSPPTRCLILKYVIKTWEVLNGVGVDGVGGIFVFFFFFFRFSSLFRFFFRFSSLFFAFLRFSSFLPILLEQGQTTAIYWENGEFHSDPVCTDPVRNFPKKLNCQN